MNEKTVHQPETQGSVPGRERTRTTTYTPRVDILETDDELVVYADVPGVKQDDVDLRFENGELILNCRCAPRHAEAAFLSREYGVGDYFRLFQISEDIDAEKISAALKNGVLTVHLPKREAVKPRKISVQGT